MGVMTNEKIISQVRAPLIGMSPFAPLATSNRFVANDHFGKFSPF